MCKFTRALNISNSSSVRRFFLAPRPSTCTSAHLLQLRFSHSSPQGSTRQMQGIFAKSKNINQSPDPIQWSCASSVFIQLLNKGVAQHSDEARAEHHKKHSAGRAHLWRNLSTVRVLPLSSPAQTLTDLSILFNLLKHLCAQQVFIFIYLVPHSFSCS